MGGSNVVSMKEKREEYKERQELAAAYRDKILTEARAVYDWCLGEGMKPGEAFQLTDEINKDMYDYWVSMEHMNIDMHVQKTLEVSWLEKYSKWGSMDREERNSLLWGLGFNSKFIEPKQMRRLIKKGGKTVLTDVVYGVERLDKEWIGMRDDSGSPYASDPAREVAHYCKYGKY